MALNVVKWKAGGRGGGGGGGGMTALWFLARNSCTDEAHVMVEKPIHQIPL
jgi:hypothetical protein